MNKRKITIFASGSGTNAENIIHYFTHNDNATVIMVLCNKENAGVIKRAEKYKIPVHVFNKEMLQSGEVLKILKKYKTDFIVLAGFLWLMPLNIIKEFKQRIINIHPALLPKYGGKGMYGMNVHNAVVHNKEKESGITIHYVNEEYDRGSIIFQAKCNIEKNDKAEDVAVKVHQLEYDNFPKVIESLIKEL